MKRILLTFLLLLPVLSAAQEKRNLLTDKYNRNDISKYCSYSFDWVKFPSYYDRAAWEAVPDAKREATIAAGEAYIGYDWPNILPTMYLEFTRTGNRNVIDVAIAKRLSILRSLFYAELMEGKGRFLDDIINGVFTYCEQTYWGMSATFYLYKYGDSQSDPVTKLPDDTNPVIDLTVGDVASTLSWIWYFLHDEFDKVSPVISDRLVRELHKKVLEPYYTKNDLWWITGWDEGRVNNWTPWCSYNVFTTILLIEKDPAKRLDGFYKTMRSVDLFINSYPADGGCDEGPSYWGQAVGCLYDYLSLLSDCSGGEINIYDNDIIREMGRYIYKLYVGNGVNFVNFADAPGKINHDGARIIRYGQSIGDPGLAGFGAFLVQQRLMASGAQALIGDVGQSLSNIFELTGDVTPREILVSEAYLPDLQVAVGRDREGSNEGFFFAAKGGHNEEQHNHNDVGSFILYCDGEPVFIDPGVGTYTRETFSGDRYKIWFMQSGYHNLPMINGVMQMAGRRFKAGDTSFKSSPGRVSFSTDISGAYPEDAKVSSWTRQYILQRGKKFTVSDSYSLTAPSEGTKVIFMTPLDCTDKGGVLELSGGDLNLRMSYPSSRMSCSVEEVVLDDTRLSRVWGARIYRIVFDLKGGKSADRFTFEVSKVK